MLGFKTIEEFTLQECEEYLKNSDISIEDRQRTENRKMQLVSIRRQEMEKLEKRAPETVIDRFPNIKFVMNPKRHFIPAWFWWTLPVQLLGATASMGGLLALLWFFYHFRRKALKNRFVEETDDKFIFISDLYKLGIYNKNTLRILVPIKYDNIVKIGDGFFVVEKSRKKGVYKRKKTIVPVEYDNVSVIHSDYFMVERYGKKGVYKRKKNIIPVEYDKMQWNSTNNVFNAERSGRQIIIDINGKELN